jgi:uncharacterized protein (DUF58 family)
MPFRSSETVPLADGAALMREARRHLAARTLLALALVGLLAAGVAVARGLDPQESAFLPRGRNAVVVLDLSKSVEGAAYHRVRRVLEDVVAAKKPVGLVIFSDAPYELLPPGSPAAHVEPLLRYFRPVRGRGAGAQYPPNPWQQAFSGGTSVSSGLALAHAALRRDRVRDASVLLVSDLEIPFSDVAALAQETSELRRDGIALRVVPLFPTSDARFVFERIAGRSAFVGAKALARTSSEGGVRSFAAPSERVLLLLVGLIVLLLAVNERWCGRLQLPWPSPGGGRP